VASPNKIGKKKINKKLNRKERTNIAIAGVAIVPHIPNTSRNEKDDFIIFPLTKIINPTNKIKMSKNKKTVIESPKKEGVDKSGANVLVSAAPALIIL